MIGRWAAVIFVFATPITGCAIGYEVPQCIALKDFDSWRAYDRTRLTLFKQGQSVGTLEVVESIAGGNPLYLTHKIWFEARDHQLCGQRDVIVADGRRMHISRIVSVKRPNDN